MFFYVKQQCIPSKLHNVRISQKQKKYTDNNIEDWFKENVSKKILNESQEFQQLATQKARANLAINKM